VVDEKHIAIFPADLSGHCPVPIKLSLPNTLFSLSQLSLNVGSYNLRMPCSRQPLPELQ